MASGLYTVANTDTYYAQDANQLLLAFLAQADLGGISFYAPLSAPGALTAALSSGAGNLTGAYTYAVTFVTGFVDGGGILHVSGETALGTASGVVNPSAQNVDLTNIPAGTVGIIARKVYRTKAGGSIFYFDFEISDNTTTSWTDSTTDANLGAQAANVNTTGTSFTIPAGISTPMIAGTPSFTQGASVASGQTLTLAGATVAGAPTWSLGQSAPEWAATGTGTQGRFIGATSGAPTTGTWALNDCAVDETNATIWVCTTAGTPGTWAKTGASAATPTALGTVETAQAMGGTPVAPVILATTTPSEVEITGTTAQTVLTATLGRNGNVRVTGSYRLTATAQVTLTVSFTDGGGTLQSNVPWYTGPAGQVAGTYLIDVALPFFATTATAINVQATCTVANVCYFAGTMEGL